MGERVQIGYGDTRFVVNQFGREKTGDMLLWESKFHALAAKNPVEVVYEQMGWIGKTRDELVCKDSTYLETLSQELIEELLAVREYTNEELKQMKLELSKKYRKELFADIVSKNGSFSTEKFQKILKQNKLQLESHPGSDKKMRYTVIREEKIMGKEPYRAVYADNGIGIYTDAEKYEQDKEYMKRPQVKACSTRTEALSFAIEGYNKNIASQDPNPDYCFLMDLNNNWFYFSKDM